MAHGGRGGPGLGSWGLGAYGAVVGLGAALQAAEDGLLGRRPRLAPSRAARSWRERVAGVVMVAGGMLAPLAIQLAHARVPRPLPDERDHRRAREAEHEHAGSALVAAALALGGSLALRCLVTREGYRSALTTADTWALTRRADRRPRVRSRGTSGASVPDLERWRDTGARLRIRYEGAPDMGARAMRIEPLR